MMIKLSVMGIWHCALISVQCYGAITCLFCSLYLNMISNDVFSVENGFDSYKFDRYVFPKNLVSGDDHLTSFSWLQAVTVALLVIFVLSLFNVYCFLVFVLRGEVPLPFHTEIRQQFQLNVFGVNAAALLAKRRWWLRRRRHPHARRSGVSRVRRPSSGNFSVVSTVVKRGPYGVVEVRKSRPKTRRIRRSARAPPTVSRVISKSHVIKTTEEAPYPAPVIYETESVSRVSTHINDDVLMDAPLRPSHIRKSATICGPAEPIVHGHVDNTGVMEKLDKMERQSAFIASEVRKSAMKPTGVTVTESQLAWPSICNQGYDYDYDYVAQAAKEREDAHMLSAMSHASQESVLSNDPYHLVRQSNVGESAMRLSAMTHASQESPLFDDPNHLVRKSNVRESAMRISRISHMPSISRTTSYVSQASTHGAFP